MQKDNQRNDFTYRLAYKNIEKGMKILDVGCGNGEISFLLADIVGKSGSVVGIDINEAAIKMALSRKEVEGIENISFIVANLNEIGVEKYDVVFGRRVLMYQEDPADTVNMLKKVLKPGGLMIFQESDEAGTQLNSDEYLVHNMVQELIWNTVKHEGGKVHIGSELYGLMKNAGLTVLNYNSEVVLQTLESGSDLAWLVRQMEQRIRECGYNIEVEGIEERLKEEMIAINRAFVRDLTFGICAKKEMDEN